MIWNRLSGIGDFVSFIVGTLDLLDLALLALPIAAFAGCLWLLEKAFRWMAGEREVVR